MAVRSKSNGGGCWGGIFFWCSRWGFTAAFLLELVVVCIMSTHTPIVKKECIEMLYRCRDMFS